MLRDWLYSRGGQGNATNTIVAMYLSRMHMLNQQRIGTTTRHRNIGAPGQREQGQSIARRMFDMHISAYSCNRLKLNLGRGQCQKESQGIIDAGISVKNDTRQELPPVGVNLTEHQTLSP